jgi:uncharacterized membrane protein
MLTQKERTEAARAHEAHTNGEILSALVAASDPHAPPTEEEVLSLILGEMTSVCSRWIRKPLSK